LREGEEDFLEERFREFGEKASVFVKEVSARHDFSYRGESSSLRDNVSITKKVFSKWSIEIIITVYSLREVGFGDLKRLLRGISSRVLSQKLKDLEEIGLLQREVMEGRPPSVRYTLSAKGETLAKLGEPVILYLRHEKGPARSQAWER
jgi:DNA-binding HxlR family transcriptional regulator